MDYKYENLGPERFQQLCQSLLTKEFPDIQCFPVGQPDGGRDAIAYLTKSHDAASFLLFQVKFVRAPEGKLDIRKWLLEVMQAETPKVARLVPKGAARYYLLTNVSGTSHLGAGSMDKLNNLLTRGMPIPAFCWWRDDLNRRLDVAWDLKWLFPELLSGQDMLRVVIESGTKRDQARTSRAIQAFIRTQYENDKKIRFKQVELHNDLVQLFVDVPVLPRTLPARPEQMNLLRKLGIELKPDVGIAHYQLLSHDEPKSIGATDLLLNPAFQQHFSQIVLEGAPGQGKSTLAQYTCQAYRMRLLRDYEALAALPKQHVASGLRVPFRIDLRDFATWLTKQNPFSADPADVPTSWQRSLESFMAAQIAYYSGGVKFTVDDLHELASVSALLVVLDGLDEVADAARRDAVVKEIVDGARRLSDLSASLQIVVTSRPTAFANVRLFPEEQFTYFTLLPLSRQLITEYAERWLKARRLEGREAGDVRRILAERLEQPHLRDLARNPMQLTILLSLIHTRGVSLPDKRTALYDSYVTLFFDREAEKSDIVRQHRDLLVDIHRYLGWLLHASAETGKNRGSIGEAELKLELDAYLKSEGRDQGLVALLFTGMIERIVFLVSRVQGTFEFEVQPLREYFAARHLYDTAPYSPPGNERQGTKPDRFEAIAKNVYWFNVTRFYAGCYSKGELGSLVRQLEQLRESDAFRDSAYPARLAGMLLADWVFYQDQHSNKDAVRLIMTDLKLAVPAAFRLWPPTASDGDLMLPSGCGREDLVGHCFELLQKGLKRDFAMEVCYLLRSNAPPEEIDQEWLRVFRRQDVADWIGLGYWLGSLGRVAERELRRIPLREENGWRHAHLLLLSGRGPFLEAAEDRFEIAIGAILDNAVVVHSRQSLLEKLAGAVDAFTYSRAFLQPGPVPLREVVARYYGRSLSEEVLASPRKLGERAYQVVQTAEEWLGHDAAEWVKSLEPWEAVVESARQQFGDRWAFYCLATVSAGIRSRDFVDRTTDDLLAADVSLCRRARFGRLRPGAAAWWRRQLEQVTSREERLFAVLMFLTWGGLKSIYQHRELLSGILKKIDRSDWRLLFRALERTLQFTGRAGRDSFGSTTAVGHELAALLALRFSERAVVEQFGAILKDYDGDDEILWSVCMDSAIRAAVQSPTRWNQALETIESGYRHGAEMTSARVMIRRDLRQAVPLSVARKIVARPENYPSLLVHLAEELCRREASRKVVLVSDVARQQRWF